jgi:hypothetical protein
VHVAVHIVQFCYHASEYCWINTLGLVGRNLELADRKLAATRKVKQTDHSEPVVVKCKDSLPKTKPRHFVTRTMSTTELFLELSVNCTDAKWEADNETFDAQCRRKHCNCCFICHAHCHYL